MGGDMILDAAGLLHDLKRRGIRLRISGTSLQAQPRSALTPEVLEEICRHRTALIGMIAQEQPAGGGAVSGGDAGPDIPPVCPVCCAKNWIRSIPGGGVFCGGCTDPAEIGLAEGQYRPANDEELCRLADEYARLRELVAEEGEKRGCAG